MDRVKCVNDRLRELYKPCMERFRNSGPIYKKSAWPYLLCASADYVDADFKIMVFGQETCGWGKLCDHAACGAEVQTLMKEYDDFVKADGRSSPFWNLNRHLRNNLAERTSDRSLGWIYNNVVKLGRVSRAGCDEQIYQWMLQGFNVLRQEVEILQPDMLLCFSGPAYDHRLEALCGQFDVEEVAGGDALQLCRLHFKDVAMPETYRCYHPGYLQRTGVYWDAIEVLDELLAKAVMQRPIAAR